MRNRGLWKVRERQTARLLGTERIPSSGKTAPDILTEDWAVEHKSRAALPGWLLDAVAQATRNAPAGTRPAVVLTAGQGPGRPLVRLVVMQFAVWAAPAQAAHDGEEHEGDGVAPHPARRRTRHHGRPDATVSVLAVGEG